MPKSGSKIAQRKNTRKPPTQCCRYDLTIFDDLTSNEIRQIFKEFCKKYCFQQEKGTESGKNHFQCRISLKQKKRKGEAIKLFAQKLSKFHLAPTSNENKDNDFYAMKADTRIDGPFTDCNETFIPKDVEAMKELRPFQKSIMELCKLYTERGVNIIYEPNGNKGKTRLVRYCMCHGNAKKLPYCKEYRDVMRMAFDVGVYKNYFFDMPRALPKKQLEDFFAGIEELKSGYAFDERNHFKDRLFDPPNIFIFTNILPDQTLLSKDMWKIWTINDNYELVEYKDPITDPLLQGKEIVSDYEFRSSESEELQTESDSDNGVLTPTLTTDKKR